MHRGRRPPCPSAPEELELAAPEELELAGTQELELRRRLEELKLEEELAAQELELAGLIPPTVPQRPYDPPPPAPLIARQRPPSRDCVACSRGCRTHRPAPRK